MAPYRRTVCRDGTQVAVEELSLDINKGEVTALLGR